MHGRSPRTPEAEGCPSYKTELGSRTTLTPGGDFGKNSAFVLAIREAPANNDPESRSG